MLNLLPPEKKKEVEREYQLRFYSVIMAATSFVFIAGIAISLPYAYSAWTAGMLADQKLAGLVESNQSSTTKEVLNKFDFLNQELTALKPTLTNATTTTTAIKEIVSDRPNGIKINNFIVTFAGKTGWSINVTGVAGSRDDLSKFSKTLSTDNLFTSVDLPISDFSQKTNVEYSLTITLGQK